jgi:hypothetical protein
MLYLAPCPELVEGVDFIKGFCLAVVGTTTPQYLPPTFLLQRESGAGSMRVNLPAN